MRNVVAIVAQDLRHLFSNVMSTVIMVGLVVLPSLFAWYNILACWDVFDNTGNLKVAVANSDEGYESDLVPLRINVGDEVVAALRGNDQIGWVFTDEDDAIDGTESGKYYAAVVIPESFSRDMLTFYTDDVQHAKILYYVNEKKNAIAPRITGVGADTVSYEINEVFSDTVSEISLAIAQSLSNYADQGDADGRIAELSNHMRRASDRLDQTADVLDLYASLGDQSQELIEGSVEMVDAQGDVVDSTSGSLESGRRALQSLAGTIGSSSSDLGRSIDANQAALADLEDNLDAVFANASASAQASAVALRQGASDLDASIEACNDEIAVLQALQGIVGQEQAVVVDSAIAAKTEEVSLLRGVQQELVSGAQELEDGDADAQANVAQLKRDVADARTQMDALESDYETNLKPSLDKLVADMDVLSDDLARGVSGLQAMGDDLSGSMDSASGAIGSTSEKVAESSSGLRDAAQDLDGLADRLDEALASDDVDALRSLLENDVADLASMLSAPVEVQRQAIYPSISFGSAMAPLYTTLALFVGSLLLMVAVKPQVSERGREGLSNPKPRQLFFGRFGVVAFLSLLQSTLMGLGNMYFVQVQVVHPVLFMLCYWFAGLVFSFIIYTLVVSFANLGKAFAVMLLIAQVTACGGSYPLQILPGFVQWLSPYVPATHVVNAMRAAMMGVYQNDYWIAMFKLSLFIVPFLLLGLVLRKAVERFMRFYLAKVEASKLIS